MIALLVPRHSGRGNESARWLRAWLQTYDIELVTLEIGRTRTSLVWLATVMDGNRVQTHTLEVPEGEAHAKNTLRRVGRRIVEARGS